MVERCHATLEHQTTPPLPPPPLSPPLAFSRPVATSDVPSAGTHPIPDNTDTEVGALRKLETLRSEQLISDVEYASKRDEILRRL